jgi:hypothetical protein
VPQGVVSIVDAGRGTPAVHFGRDGTVTGLAAEPPDEPPPRR